MALGALAGIAVGIALWSALLDVEVRRHSPGLWTVRAHRIVVCGLDYNGPAAQRPSGTIWLSCDSEAQSWQLWPPR